jgi:DNA-binding MarR family transcriptional regulator
MRKRDLTNVNYRALATLRFEIRRFLNFSAGAARKAGIEPQQHQALLAIKGLTPGVNPSVGVLANRLQIKHHSAVELTKRLEASGLIRRTPSPTDRREVLLNLTRRGDELMKRLSRSHEMELESAGPSLLRALMAVISHHAKRKNPRRISP